jgi:D-alanyl-D-alanine carboxypeptidase
MKVLLLLLLLLAAPLQAQTFGPTAKYQWNMAAPSAPEAQGYPYTIKDDVATVRPLPNVTCTQGAGVQTCQAPILTYPDGVHTASLTYVLTGLTSPQSNTVTFTFQTPATQCGTISVQTYSATVAVGTQGNVAFQVLNSSKPIVDLQVRFGTQVVGELLGTDLRASMGLYFSVPRTPGPYSLTVYAKDSVGCSVVTTAARTVTVQ